MYSDSQYAYSTAVESIPPAALRTAVRVLLLGAPGVGKGTQAKELEKLWGVPHISTGDLLRTHASQGSSLGRVAREMMGRGELIPDSLVAEMVASRLEEPDTFNGYILDGFPRTISQAIWLDDRLAALGSGPSMVVVSIRMDFERLLDRITGRRSCPLCHTISNVYLNRPKRDGYCDKDGAMLIRRADDSEEVYQERLRLYRRLTAPVAEHYRSLGRFAEVDGDRPIEEIAAEIVAVVDRLNESPDRAMPPAQDRTSPDRISPDRTGSHRSGSDRTGSDRTGPDRRKSRAAILNA
jgi:adenylate kinase